MFGHLPELFIVLLIALIVFGPEKLPEVAANAGKMVREVREIVNDAMHPLEEEPPDDFSTYYHESMARSGEEIPTVEEPSVLEYESELATLEPEAAEASVEVSAPGESPDENLSPEAEIEQEAEPSADASAERRVT
jgi:TatA/E family protein of Tat protein translocase